MFFVLALSRQICVHTKSFKMLLFFRNSLVVLSCFFTFIFFLSRPFFPSPSSQSHPYTAPSIPSSASLSLSSLFFYLVFFSIILLLSNTVNSSSSSFHSYYSYFSFLTPLLSPALPLSPSLPTSSFLLFFFSFLFFHHFS